MKIITYRDLKFKDDILMLWLKSFGWPGTPEWLTNFKKYETRIGDGPVGMCGLIKGKLVGFVGIMSIPTRTKHGEIEHVGGIYGVAVRPSYMRRGIGRKLLEASEEYLHQQGAKLIFLTTSRSIVAYKWYCEVGYKVVDIVDKYPYMYKIFNPPQAIKKENKSQKKHKFDINKIQKLWEWYTNKHCGFTIRSLKDLKSRGMEDVFSKKLSIITDGGYALLRSSCGTILYREIIARNQKVYRELIKLSEAKAKYAAAAVHPFDPKAQKVFEKSRYQVDLGGYDVLMCKQLTGKTFANFYDDSFMISRLDWF